ncbi:hypothetical protein [Methylobacterium planeticum]|uniref:Uncharacterized protein n=1 Tax=Methylobacterium planeticum TaxID=2615211 RepID=A0A6N6MK78_9HYPH|nr:hypothetical protein [Methylobacterium planeticum]KAB1070464.1 hypothetical protein F6X51_22275 [Methylobacterium planeticum]
MQDEVERLRVLVGAFELAIGHLFADSPGGEAAKGRFVADLRALLDATTERQPGSPAAETYAALLRRLGAAGPDDPSGLGVVPTPEQGAPPVGPGA